MYLHPRFTLPLINPQMPRQMNPRSLGQQSLPQIRLHSPKCNPPNPLPALHENNADMLFADDIGADNLAIRQREPRL